MDEHLNNNMLIDRTRNQYIHKRSDVANVARIEDKMWEN